MRDAEVQVLTDSAPATAGLALGALGAAPRLGGVTVAAGGILALVEVSAGDGGHVGLWSRLVKPSSVIRVLFCDISVAATDEAAASGGVVGGSPLLNLALASLADAGESTDDLPEIASLTEGGVVGGAPLLNLALASLADAEPTEDLGGVASPIDTGDPTDDLRALASTAAVGSEDNALSVELEGEGLLKSPRNGVEAVSCCR